MCTLQTTLGCPCQRWRRKKVLRVGWWEDALIECGYDPDEVRKEKPHSQSESTAVDMALTDSPQQLNRLRPFSRVEDSEECDASSPGKES